MSFIVSRRKTECSKKKVANYELNKTESEAVESLLTIHSTQNVETNNFI